MDEGKRQYRNGNYQAAIGELTRVIDEAPDRADAFYLIGYAHLMLRQYPGVPRRVRPGVSARSDSRPSFHLPAALAGVKLVECVGAVLTLAARGARLPSNPLPLLRHAPSLPATTGPRVLRTRPSRGRSHTRAEGNSGPRTRSTLSRKPKELGVDVLEMDLRATVDRENRRHARRERGWHDGREADASTR